MFFSWVTSDMISSTRCSNVASRTAALWKPSLCSSWLQWFAHLAADSAVSSMAARRSPSTSVKGSISSGLFAPPLVTASTSPRGTTRKGMRSLDITAWQSSALELINAPRLSTMSMVTSDCSSASTAARTRSSSVASLGLHRSTEMRRPPAASLPLSLKELLGSKTSHGSPLPWPTLFLSVSTAAFARAAAAVAAAAAARRAFSKTCGQANSGAVTSLPSMFLMGTAANSSSIMTS
mmetsp:Transcript_81483/g.149011  ORF Transcript_81483/g.149011 Transcript_81483/m.149011 type:complete len:236 (+) Transcript_81483:2027-2734(+)